MGYEKGHPDEGGGAAILLLKMNAWGVAVLHALLINNNFLYCNGPFI